MSVCVELTLTPIILKMEEKQSVGLVTNNGLITVPQYLAYVSPGRDHTPCCGHILPLSCCRCLSS